MEALTLVEKHMHRNPIEFDYTEQFSHPLRALHYAGKLQNICVSKITLLLALSFRLMLDPGCKLAQTTHTTPNTILTAELFEAAFAGDIDKINTLVQRNVIFLFSLYPVTSLQHREVHANILAEENVFVAVTETGLGNTPIMAAAINNHYRVIIRLVGILEILLL